MNEKQDALQRCVEAGTMLEEHRHAITDAVTSRENIIVSGLSDGDRLPIMNAIIDVISKRWPKLHPCAVEWEPHLHCESENFKKVLITEDTPFDAIVDSCGRMFTRILLVGEIRSGIAHDTLHAWNTGSGGSVAGFAAKDAETALDNLTDIVATEVFDPDGGDKFLEVLEQSRGFVNGTLDLIVHAKAGIVDHILRPGTGRLC